jgi:hypothetical protein
VTVTSIYNFAFVLGQGEPAEHPVEGVYIVLGSGNTGAVGYLVVTLELE